MATHDSREPVLASFGLLDPTRAIAPELFKQNDEFFYDQKPVLTGEYGSATGE
jgi:hypothetical protein